MPHCIPAALGRKRRLRREAEMDAKLVSHVLLPRVPGVLALLRMAWFVPFVLG